ncbi:MAG TPA: hypothetical protein VIO64_13335 [Pseudobacteroides sp.]|uniref:hypothetical protein n=1 Tax=Pseudobacteroides sp. TaxID=1968840 RepID=UPI002F9345B1
MDERKLSEAVENISLIKGVIDKTSRSFSAFSKIFIYWGLLFILNSIVMIAMNQNRESTMEIMGKYPVLGYFFPLGIVALAAGLIYRQISKKIPLVGLEKHLMKLWMLVLIMNVIPVKVNINTPALSGTGMQTIALEINNFSMTLFSLAIALIATALFTGYKQPMKIGVVYIALSALHAYTWVPIFNSTLIQLLYAISLPFTFLYTGFYLRAQQARREQLGYKLNS